MASTRACKTGCAPAGLGLALVLAAGAASAEGPAHARVRLEYVVGGGASSCPDRDTFGAAVATRLGYDPFAPDAAKLLRVEIQRRGATLVAVVRFVGEPPDAGVDKEIVGASGACADVSEAAAFASAIWIDPRASFPGAAPPPARTPEESDRPASGAVKPPEPSPGTWPWYEPPKLPTPQPPAPPRPAWRYRVAFGPAFCVGCTPGPSLGAEILAGLSRGSFGVDLGARADLPTRAEAPSGRATAASTAAGTLFPHARFGPLLVGPCLLLGRLFGESDGERQVSTWAAVGARAGAAFVVHGPLFVRAALEGLFVVSRVSLRVEGAEVWSSNAVAGGASAFVGLEY